MFVEVTKQHSDLRTEISTGTFSTLYRDRKSVFEPRKSNGSEAFSLLTCFDATKFVSLSAFTLMETNRRRIWAEPMPKNSRSPLQVVKSHSKTSLLKRAVSRNSAKLGNYKMPVKLTET